MSDRFFYRVRGLNPLLDGRVIELREPARSDNKHLERIYITPEEYTKIRAEQDIDR